ncbi:carbohydrate ABC transporter permease [Paenibacillus sp. OV219]|uniref:carbohydrate ABC transporter permease n=1 Tax=Paenibacillus sp. OV219 TaxID=1884377 RepID=UPI0008D41F6E|nr:carbohydrate ABC transporter permease [Paenibacillus sp. OV219]SEO89580.1 putative aldouronate transport system permease protein [Paenibacillus sp. OV219]
MQKSGSVLGQTPKLVINLIFIIYSLMCILPVVLVLSISMTDERSLMTDGYHLIPKVFSSSGYDYIISGTSTILNAYKVSLFVTLVGAFSSLLVTSLIGYALSRPELKYRGQISFIIFFTILFNGGLAPYYILVTRYLHMKDTLLILILALLVSPGNILLMRNFFKDVPSSIIESARIDGSGEFRTFFQIVLPVSTPVLATIGLFASIAYWNDWFTYSLFIENGKLYNLQYLLQALMSNLDYLQSNAAALKSLENAAAMLPGESARMATCILSIGPIILLYPFLQKYFVKGLTLGAVKS